MKRFAAHVSVPLISFVTVVLMTPARVLHAQAPQFAQGPFTIGQTWFIGPGTSTGVLPLTNPPRLRVDTNGNGTVNDPVDAIYDLPSAIAPDPSWSLEYRLSPSQDALYVKKISSNGATLPPCLTANDAKIYMYHLDGAPLMTPFTGEQGACMKGSLLPPLGALSIDPRFHDQPNECIRTMALSGNGENGNQAILWADLVNGVIHVDRNTYDEDVFGVQGIQFAPSGNAAFVIHGAGPGQAPPTRYALIDLCKSHTANVTDMAVTPGNWPAGTSITAHVEPDGPMGLQMLLRSDGAPVLNSEIALDLSCCNPSATQACCPPDGLCDDTVTPAECTGTLNGMPDPGGRQCPDVQCPQPCCKLNGTCDPVLAADCVALGGSVRAAGDTCSSLPACPALRLQADVIGPGLVTRGAVFPYTIEFQNLGTLAATLVRLEDDLPSGIQFVSASNGGTLAGNTVVWNLGNLAAGASGTVTLSVRAGCGASSYTNKARITSSQGLTFFGFQDFTLVTPPAPVTMSVASFPSSGLPLKGGDLVTHTVTLINTGASATSTLRIPLTPGEAMTFDAVLDSGGGLVTTLTPSSIIWDGTLAPSADTAIVLTTRLNACVGISETRLEGDNTFPNGDLTVRDACGEMLGTARADTLPVQPALDLALRATNLNPPATLKGRVLFRRIHMQLTRPGAPLEFEITIGNPDSAPIALASLSFPIHAAITPAGNPPFLGPQPPGTTYDAPTRTISWSGPLDPNVPPLRITFGGSFTAPTLRTVTLSVSASNGTCTVGHQLRLAKVPQPPAGPHVVGLSYTDLFTFQPDVDLLPQRQVDLPTDEGPAGSSMGRGANGDVWLTTRPLLRFNPYTLELQAVDPDIVAAMGIQGFDDVAVDPTDGSLILARSGGGFVRHIPGSSSFTPFGPFTTGPPGFFGLRQVLVESTGRIVFISWDTGSIYRFDPASPADIEVVGYGDGLALDTTGDYVTVAASLGGSLSHVHRDTLDLTILIPDLSVVTGRIDFVTEVTVGPNGDIYFGDESFRLFRVRRGPSITTDTLNATLFRNLTDLAFVPGGSCVPTGLEICDGVDNDCNGTVDDGNPGGGAGCSTGLPGACGPGTTQCSGGSVQCIQNNQPSTDLCDGVDNDCSGQVDEDFVSTPTACGVGACAAAGVTICSGGVPGNTCAPGAPATEICDAVDNDCNGTVDDVTGGCGFVVVDPTPGEVLSCSTPAPPTITWLPGGYDRYRVFVSWDPNLAGKTKVSSGGNLLRSASYTVPLKKWLRACANAGQGLYIAVYGLDRDLPKGDPLREAFTPTVMVSTN